jgi:hypothetical protein
MARGTLHAPKPDEQRRRRNAPAHDTIELERHDELLGPELHELTGRRDWPECVTRWYATWRCTPQARIFESTDWLRLGMLAPIVEAHFNRPSAAALSEIRMNEERLGATVVDRMRARMRIDDEDRQEAAVLALVPGESDEDLLS